jgi:hypothetical protein
VHLLRITGLAQVPRVPNPVKTTLMAIAGFSIIRGFDRVVIVGELGFRGKMRRSM